MRWSRRFTIAGRLRAAVSSTTANRGVQYVSIKYTERLAAAGIEPSVGSVGDSYDNALAESVNGLYKSELIYNEHEGPWRTVEDVELATLSWVHWWNTERLLEPIGYVPPVEFEQTWRNTVESEVLSAAESPAFEGGGTDHRGCGTLEPLVGVSSE